ncbi:bacterial alpha-L-rhamnosidase domain protein [Sclerotinia borealis F-4128]|uniref:Bacterial alpha-L-rhamnosidase domain protein n=1 Tax=Sclerotinia borealis (strain F-4128) TaxID=1432307 RepID=W9CKU1_SCLBF|nr:bacterial alpha-L-rhamnosidase domain protein [Sclerotinia borealis F-4128]
MFYSDSTNLLYVSGTNDWGRLTQGGHNSEANMLFYRVLTTGSTLATWASALTLSTVWASLAHTLQSSINKQLFSHSTSAFVDSDTSPTIYPQDANSLALAYGISPLNTTSLISQQLLTNWDPIGAISPEPPPTTSTSTPPPSK